MGKNMKLPDLSNSISIGGWRYIQSIHEPPERRNPDNLVGQFLSVAERWHGKWLSQKKLAGLRSRPFYYYLIARTKYYDATFLDAINGETRHIINIGAGSDTRAYRFLDKLTLKGISVLECDQVQAIRAKRQIAQRHWSSRYISYLPLDLNDEAWPDFEFWLTENVTGQTFVFMEGVSPYVNAETFARFLELLATKLPSGSYIAYDFKLRGVKDDFGRGDRTINPFRLPGLREDVTNYHEKRGYRLEHMELSNELSVRLISDVDTSNIPLFLEDGLVQLRVVD
jgi:methyltransferase (TIGR00027 family)